MSTSTPLAALLPWLCVLIAVACSGSILFWTLRLGIGPTPSSAKVKRALLQHLPSPSQVHGNIIELGSGWGGLLTLLQQHYPQHTLIGIERSPLPALWSRLMHPSVQIQRRDFLTTVTKAEWQSAGLVLCYLYPRAMQQLEQQVLPYLPKGCFVATHTFRLPSHQPIAVFTVDDLYRTPVYVYCV